MSIGSMMKAHDHTRMRFNSSEYEDESMEHMNPCGEAYCGPICTAMPHTHAETDVSMMKEGMGDYLEIPGAFFQREDGITHTDHYCGDTGLGFSSGFAHQHQPRGLFSLLRGGGRQIEEHRPLRQTCRRCLMMFRMQNTTEKPHFLAHCHLNWDNGLQNFQTIELSIPPNIV